MRDINTIIVHHSASPDTWDVARIDKEHKERGFSGIGYHYLLRRDPGTGVWLVSQGRPVDQVGAHDQGQNSDSIGICLAGNYSDSPIPAAAWETLLMVVAAVCKRFGLTQVNVEGHRENESKETPTECPGKNFDLEKLRHGIANKLMWV